MNALQALRLGDPARDLAEDPTDPRDEQLLRAILALPVAPASGAPTTPPQRRRVRDWTPLLVTAAVAVLVAGVTVVALRAAPTAQFGADHPATTAQTGRADLESALFAKLPAGAAAQPALTWTEAARGGQGDMIDLTARTLLLAGACDGGGSIRISVSGSPDRTLACAQLSTIGPIDLSALIAANPSGTGGVDVMVATGHPRYVVKTVGIPTAELPTSTPTAAATNACAARDLTLTATAMEGAAGTDYGFIDIRNHGAAACSLRGQPTAFLTDRAGGARIGAPAGHTGPSDAKTVTLQPNGTRASLRVSVTNIAGYSTGGDTYNSTCGHAVTGAGWSITLPGTTTAVFVPFSPAHRLLCSNSTLSISAISQVVPFTRSQ